MINLSKKINEVLFSLFEENPDVVIAGEDLLDPYGGAFKVTLGLSTAYPNRVIPFPISEAALTGWAIGRSMSKKPTIIEIMFSDFSTLTFDQIVNNAAKLAYMYNHQVNVPLLIRLANGGGRGYGATHSQSMEKAFLGFPNIAIHIVDRFTPNLKNVYSEFLITKSPTMIFETKTDYPKPYEPEQLNGFNGTDGLIISAGTASSRVMEAAQMLQLDGFEPTIFLLQDLNNKDEYVKLANICCKYKFFLFVEDTHPHFGPYDRLCSELRNMDSPVTGVNLGGPNHAIPSSRELEKLSFYSEHDIYAHFIETFEKCY